ncbi:MAG: polymer-forming cytoskeletal protein [Pseudomonadota bacterium]|nr:polymer-forming cytoskeletal protein [Pseudomonadota bacterium]
MLMKNDTVSRRRAKTPKEAVPRLNSGSTSAIDISDKTSTPLANYDEPAFSTSKNANVLSVGSGVSFSGRIIKAESVILEGTADGEILAKSIEISPSGSLTGSVKTDNLIVAGSFSGDASIVGSLSVRSTGSIEGKIDYGSLSVQEGGVVLGTLAQDKVKELANALADQSLGKPPNTILPD